MKKQKYNVTIRGIYPYNFNCDDVCYQGIQIYWSCDYIGYGVLTIEITNDGKYEFDDEHMGLEFTKAVLKAYNSYLLKKAKDYFAAGYIISKSNDGQDDEGILFDDQDDDPDQDQSDIPDEVEE